MYYRLKDGFALRGWDKLTGAIIKRPYNQLRVLTDDQLRLLLVCDGVTESKAFYDLLSREEKETLERWVKSGIIEKTEHPIPLNGDGVYKVYPNRFFPDFFWSMTGKCNYKCRHCYMDAPEGCLGELSHEESLQLIDEMADCGALKIDLTGGEPLVRKDFWELVDALLSKHIRIGQLYTNAGLLNRSVLENFLKRGIKPQICISFDGINWHDWMRGVKGAEQAAIEAFKLCREMGFPASASMCVHKGNVKTLPDTVNALTKLGVMGISVGNVTPTPLWKKNSEGMGLSFPEYVDAMIEYIPKFYEDGMPNNIILTGVIELYKDGGYDVVTDRLKDSKNPEECFLCGAVRSSCYITPEGRVVPCMPMTEIKEQDMFPVFLEKGLRNILTDSNYFSAVNKRLTDLMAENKECRECPYLYSCGGGCRASAFHSSGNLMGVDPNVCYLWKNGYIDKIKKVAEDAKNRHFRGEKFNFED